MPRGDRTGPMGMGPMTGRAAGYCAGYDVPGYMNPAGGRGFGMGRGGWGGGGRGWRNMYYATGLPGWARAGYYPYGAPAAPPVTAQPNSEAELSYLKTQAQSLQNALGEIQKRMDELEKAKSAESGK